MMQTLGEQSDTFQTTSKRRKFGPNHMLIYCNYPIYIYIYLHRHYPNWDIHCSKILF